MSEKKDQLNREAKQIEEEVGLNDNEEIPNELKIRMKNALDQKIREREMRSEDTKRTDAYAKLSEEDQEALRLGREMLKNQSEEKKIYTMRRKKRNIRRIVALAAVLILVCGSVMTSVGSKSYWKTLWNKEAGDETLSYVDVENMETMESEDVDEVGAYKEIAKVMGNYLVRMEYKPKDMVLKRYIIDKDQRMTVLFYQYGEEVIKYYMYTNSTDSSFGEKTIDQLLDEYEFQNGKHSILVKQYEIKNSDEERYIAEFEYKDIHYQIKGSMEKEEFEKILENLFFM